MSTLKYFIPAFVVLILLVAGVLVGISTSVFGGALRDDNRNIIVHNCTVYSDATVVVGDDISSTILAASSSRAWVMLQRLESNLGVATNTVSVSVDGGAATLGSGLELATSTTFLSFGTAGSPFTGAITGITSNSSTSVRVIECGY